MSDDRARFDRMRRILKVQKQKRLLEEWRLGHLGAEHRRIDADDADLLQSLDHTNALHGYFIEAKVRSLRKNDVERRRIVHEEAETSRRLTETRRVQKGIEKLQKEAGHAVASNREANDLETSLEAFLARGRTSLD